MRTEPRPAAPAVPARGTGAPARGSGGMAGRGGQGRGL